MFSSNASQVSSDANYIESCFSTYLYTGNSSTQTITNGIDLAGKGGLTWIKRRTSEAHYLFDTNRGALAELNTDGTEESQVKANSLTSFNSDGFSLGSWGGTNYSVAPNNTYASWTFRKQPKFFDVVTYTGDGVDPRNIAHNLGSVPGCIITKCTSTGATNWFVYHRSLGNSKSLTLNEGVAAESGTQIWGTTTPTSTVFTVGNINANTNGRTYVAYLFAHDAGGFGLSGNENVVSCGSYTGNGSATGPVVTLGYEPQWLMVKPSSTTGSWLLWDNMRGMPVGGADATLTANTADAEYSVNYVSPTATGFQIVNAGTDANASGQTYIYIAIRRGPMKVPTDGTKVFAPVARAGTSATASITGIGFTPDLVTSQGRGVVGVYNHFQDRLRGALQDIQPVRTNAENTQAQTLLSFDMNGATLGTAVEWNYSSETFINYFFRRAPSFFDEVCYTGTGSAMTVAHNLGVAPELMIVKSRSLAGESWPVYLSALGPSKILLLNQNRGMDSLDTGNYWWNSTSPTTSVFTVNNDGSVNGSGSTYVAYLFATCAGVSKVGSYTGTGTTQAINCGFTAGARFVLIKRTDSTGDWYYWDSTRGIVAGDDPYLLMNSTAAEVTSTDYIDPSSAGFEISSTAPAAINASGGSYIFLAVA